MTLARFKQHLQSPYAVLTVWGVLTLVASILKVAGGPEKYNNFLIFRGVAHHLFNLQPLYGEYPAEYLDMNHYGPLFGLIVAPFAYIPLWLALPLWIGGMAALLYWMVRKLPLPVRMTTIVLWIAANDLYGAELMQQFNIVTAALLVGSLAMIERRKEGWAALFIVVGTFVKIYGIVGLAFFFFVERKWRFIGYMALWSLAALFAPLLFVSPDYLIDQYAAWAADIAAKNGQNLFAEYQNLSLVGSVRKISGLASYSDMLLIVPAILLFMTTYLRWGQFARRGFRLVMLASLLIFLVIFSSGSETSGYIVAAVGAGVWWVTLRHRGWLEWSLLVLVLVAIFSRNLFPFAFYKEFIRGYALIALPYTAVWLHCIWRLWTEDFVADYEQKTVKGID